MAHYPRANSDERQLDPRRLPELEPATDCDALLGLAMVAHQQAVLKRVVSDVECVRDLLDRQGLEWRGCEGRLDFLCASIRNQVAVGAEKGVALQFIRVLERHDRDRHHPAGNQTAWLGERAMLGYDCDGKVRRRNASPSFVMIKGQSKILLGFLCDGCSASIEDSVNVSAPASSVVLSQGCR